MKRKPSIRPATLEKLEQFYQEALNPRHCINDVYHIKLSNWFATNSLIYKLVDRTLNALLMRISPVDFKERKDYALSFDLFMEEYENQHLYEAEKRYTNREEKKAAKSIPKTITVEEAKEIEEVEEATKEVYEEIQEQAPSVSMFSLIEQNGLLFQRVVELLEENRNVQKHIVENNMAYNLKMVNKLANIEKLLQNYLT